MQKYFFYFSLHWSVKQKHWDQSKKKLFSSVTDGAILNYIYFYMRFIYLWSMLQNFLQEI